MNRLLPLTLVLAALAGCRQPEPPGPAVVIAPEAPLTADDLVATATIDDPEFEEVTYTYSWTRDGEATELTAATVPSVETAKGQSWEVTAIASIEDVSSPAVSASVVIGNTAPAMLTASLSATEVRAGDTLTVVYTAEDADSDTLAPTIEWFVNGSSVGASESLSSDSFSKGDTLHATVFVSDDADNSDTLTTAEATVVNSTPVTADLLISPDPAYTNDVLTASANSTDADGDPVTTTYVWKVNDVEVATTLELDGATHFTRGDVVSLFATPNDGSVDGAEVAAAPVTILNALPTVTVPTVSPSAVLTNDVLTADTTAADADGDTVTVSYRWLVNEIEVGTGPTLDGSVAFSKGDVIVVQVTANDGVDDSTPQTSTPITVANSSPSAPLIAIAPEYPAAELDDLVCAVTVDSVDLDLDTFTYSVAWTVDGATFTGATTTTLTGDTVPAAEVHLYEVWTCTITATDVDGGATASDLAEIKVRSCGDSLLDEGEELDPPTTDLTTLSVDQGTCRWDLSGVEQLYCNGTCSWAGEESCDQADADVFCKLRTGNPDSVATSFEIVNALDEPGFSCPNQGSTYGTQIQVNNRGLDGVLVRYQDSSVLANHGAGRVITTPDCTNP